MVQVDQFVTEWGFPAVRWFDRSAGMLRTSEEERWLWIHHDGTHVMMSGFGKRTVLGRWDEWRAMELRTARDDMSPEHEGWLQTRQPYFVNHRTLDGDFGSGGRRRISVSAISDNEMRALHDALWKIFIEGQRHYEPPEAGVCWRKTFVPEEKLLEAGEAAIAAKGEMTVLNVGAEKCRSIRVRSRAPIPSMYWFEPVATAGPMGLGTRYHHVLRGMWVARGSHPGKWLLSFDSYKPAMEGVIVVSADLALLKDFRVAPSGEINALDIQPIKGTRPGVSIIADFRYGLSIPLTCATFAPGVDGRREIEKLKEGFRSLYLPLVGQSLSDEQIGL